MLGVQECVLLDVPEFVLWQVYRNWCYAGCADIGALLGVQECFAGCTGNGAMLVYRNWCYGGWCHVGWCIMGVQELVLC